MEAGELEMRKAFEETTTKNVKTVIEYTKNTRELVREQDKKITELKNTIVSRNNEIAELRRQVSLIQGSIYRNGSL